MKTLADQVKEFMDWRTQSDGKEFTPALMAALIAKHQMDLPAEKRCTRQNIEGLLLKGLQTPRYLVALAQSMGTTAETLRAGRFIPGYVFEQANATSQLAAEIIRADRTNVEPAPALRPFKDVPVVGTVQGGDKGYLLELEHAVGHGDGHITYPARDSQSYAVRVRGDSMRPRIKAGEFIVCEPNHECQPGDDVVVITRDGQRMVKELLYIRDDEATLGSINNGHGNITIPLADIEKMHYVAAIIPRGAFYKS